MRGGRPVWAAAAAVALLAGTAGCGGSDDADGEGGDGRGDAAPAPFLVDAVPAGYRPVAVGRGTAPQDWGEDCCGTDEPFTVLAPPGEDATGDGAVVVSATGFAGYQGGLRQSLARHPAGRHELEVDGRPAFYAPAATDDLGEAHAPELVAEVGDDIAVRVRGPGLDRDALVEVAERAEVDEGDHLRAPAVPDPPDGLEVVGSVGADVRLAALPRLAPGTDAVPGPPTARAVGWLGPAAPHGDGDGASSAITSPTILGVEVLGVDDRPPPGTPTLVVAALPGRSADLAAVPALPGAGFGVELDVRPTTVAGRPAVLLTRGEDTGVEVRRALLTHAPWGDLLVVASSGPAGVALDEAALAAVAASARQADTAAWDDFRVEAAGGPGLPPGPGATEVARGTAGDVRWLLQATPGPSGLPLVSPCLKLSTGQRACASGGGGAVSSQAADAATRGAVHHGGDVRDPVAGGDVPEFAVVVAATEAPTVRVTTPEATATAATAPVPGTGLRAAVVFADGTGLADCAGDRAAPAPDRMAVELLDAAGTAVGCVEPTGDVTPAG